MATIPTTQKFHTVADATDTSEYGSAQLAEGRTVFTMQDILDTVVVGGGIDGSGTAGSVPVFIDSNTLGDSILTASVTGVTVAGQFNVAALNTAPANASDTGVAGELRFVADFIYVCVAANTWKRVAIATW